MDAPQPTRPRTAWQVGILAVVVGVFVYGHNWYENRHDFTDLLIYRDAMVWWTDGHPLYEFWQPDATQGRLEFTYPPFAALLLFPLAWLTPLHAIWLYSVTAVAAFAASMWWLVRPMASRCRADVWFVVGLAFVLATALEPIREAYTFGQINFVLWALILLDLLVLAPRGSRWVGVGIGLATAIKIVPGIFIGYLLVTRRWRAAAVAAGTAAVATLLAAAVAPQATWTFFSDRLWHAEGVGQVTYEFNQSLTGLLARLGGGPPSPVAWLLASLPVLGYGLWRAARAGATGDEVAGLTLVGLVGGLISPVTWVHHIFWFVPALLVLVDGAARPQHIVGGLRGRAGVAALAVLTYLSVTFSVVALWAFKFDKPGGLAGFVMSNWFVWLTLALLALLPIRSATRADIPDQGRTTKSWATVD